VDDATAVQQNPANLIGITNIEAQLTPSVIYIKVDYQSPFGQSASTSIRGKCSLIFLSSCRWQMTALRPVWSHNALWSVCQWNSGSTAFSQKPPFGTLTYFAPNSSQLTTVNVNPSVAVKLTDKIRLGVGLDVMWSDLEFNQFLSPVLPNAQAQAEGDGVGVGGNVGLTWQVTDRQRLALTYRSTMTVDYSGTTTFENMPGVPGTSFGSQIKYPNIISFGYGIDLTDKIRLETDFEWKQFSQFQNLPVNIGINPLHVPHKTFRKNGRTPSPPALAATGNLPIIGCCARATSF